MKNTKAKEEVEVTNAVNEFDYSTQSESYNKHFIAWRNKKNNPYAYNYAANKNESVFIDGKGFIDESASEAESNSLNKLLYLIGAAILSMIFIENVFDKVLVLVLDFLNVNVHTTFFNSVIYGGRFEVIIILIVITVLKLVVPLQITHARLKIPYKARYLTVLKDPLELIGAVAATLATSVVMGIPSAYSDESKEIYTFFKSYDADMSVWGQKEFVIYILFDVIIVSILTEALFRGEMFVALRQYGDIYAILITSLLTGLVTQDYRLMLGNVLIAIVSSCTMLRSGSILAAIISKITYKLYLLALTIIEIDNSSDMFLTRNMFMIFVFCVSIIVVALIYLSPKRKNKKFIADYNKHIPLGKKLTMPIKITPFVAVIIICLIAAAIELNV